MGTLGSIGNGVPFLTVFCQGGMMDFKYLLDTEEYDFIKTNEHLGKHVILLAMGGSYSYGTNRADSDVDIRGIALNRKSDLIGMTEFEQFVDENTDTVLYSFNKIIKLLLCCNPNTCELLGIEEGKYLYLNDIGRELLKRKGMFLSKRAIQSFGGYADQQLRRLQNALCRDSYGQSEKERHILGSVNRAMHTFKTRYAKFEEGGIRLYIDRSKREEMETEIFMDVCLTRYPLRDYKGLWAEMSNIVREYQYLGKRNRKKDDNHLNKHAMHLIRLFMMAIDILEKGEIITYRGADLPLLLSIRNGDFKREDGSFSDEFYGILADYEKRLDYAAKHTVLPDEPDYRAVEEFVMEVNERVVRDEI